MKKIKKEINNEEKVGTWECDTAPETHHTITCKQCQEKTKVLKRYTRLCNKCRRLVESVQSKLRVYSWDFWGD